MQSQNKNNRIRYYHFYTHIFITLLHDEVKIKITYIMQCMEKIFKFLDIEWKWGRLLTVYISWLTADLRGRMSKQLLHTKEEWKVKILIHNKYQEIIAHSIFPLSYSSIIILSKDRIINNNPALVKQAGINIKWNLFIPNGLLKSIYHFSSNIICISKFLTKDT